MSSKWHSRMRRSFVSYRERQGETMRFGSFIEGTVQNDFYVFRFTDNELLSVLGSTEFINISKISSTRIARE